MFSQGIVIVLVILGGLGALVIAVVWKAKRPEKTESWPETEATIQFVGKVIGSGRGSYPLDVGDFSYVVDGEYYSGRAMISRSFSTGDVQPGNLVDKKFKVRYNPREPDKYDVSQADVGSFLLDPYDDFLMHDMGEI